MLSPEFPLWISILDNHSYSILLMQDLEIQFILQKLLITLKQSALTFALTGAPLAARPC